MLIQVDTG